MRKTWFRFLAGYALTAGVFGAAAGADLILTLEPKDLELNPISGSVPAGTRILVDVLISVDAQDEAGLVINVFDLTFDASSETIVVDSFSFLADLSAYLFQSSDLSAIGAFSFQCATANCIELTQQPTALGRAVVTVNGPGELNAAGSTGIGGGRLTSFVAIDPTGVASSVTFWLEGENLQGGILSLSVTDGASESGDDPPVPPVDSGSGSGGGGGGGGSSSPGDTPTDGPETDDDAGEPVDPEPGPDDGSEGGDEGGENADPDAEDEDGGDSPGDTTIDPPGPDDDAPPNDPPTTTTDPDETDDVTDSGAGGSSSSGRLPCGIGMVQTSVCIFLGLSGLGRARRRATRRGVA